MAQAREAMAELDALGFGAVWVPEAVGREPFASAMGLLEGGPIGIVEDHPHTNHAATQTMSSG